MIDFRTSLTDLACRAQLGVAAYGSTTEPCMMRDDKIGRRNVAIFLRTGKDGMWSLSIARKHRGYWLTMFKAQRVVDANGGRWMCERGLYLKPVAVSDMLEWEMANAAATESMCA